MLTFFIETIFCPVAGWLGYAFVKIVTLGRVELDYGSSSEGVITESIGFVVLLGLAVLFSFALHSAQ